MAGFAHGADNLEPGAPVEVYQAVVTAWLDEHPALRQTKIAREHAEAASHDDSPTGDLATIGAGTAVSDGSVAADDAAPDVSVDETSLAPAPDASVVEASGGASAAEQAAQPRSPARSGATHDEHDLDEMVVSLVAADESDVAPDPDAAVDADPTDEEVWEDLARAPTRRSGPGRGPPLAQEEAGPHRAGQGAAGPHRRTGVAHWSGW